MANVRVSQQRHEEALALYEEALQIYEACVGRESVDYANTLHNMAIVHAQRKELAKALEPCAQAIAIFEACVGPESAEARRSKQLLVGILQVLLSGQRGGQEQAV